MRLVLAIQVNCPGCFALAVPLAAKLQEMLPVVVVSTAFEDFELNTLENTERLLATGKTTSEHDGTSAMGLRNVAFDKLEKLDGVELERRVRREYEEALRQAPQLRAVPPERVIAAVAEVRRLWKGDKIGLMSNSAFVEQAVASKDI